MSRAAAPATPDAARDAFFGRPVGERVSVVTPEGVPLSFVVASAGARVGALLVDLLILLGALLLVALLGVLGFGAALFSSWAGAFWILALFLLRVLYFPLLELRWQGRTVGKRAVGIRVVDGAGGQTSAEAMIVRNLTRDVEVFLPLTVLLFPQTVAPGGPPWLGLAAGGWVALFGLFPLFNRRRLRMGDLVAGTMVVVEPRAVLLSDVGGPSPAAARPAAAGAAAAPAPEPTFTDAQLDAYGIFELQVLEDLLRTSGAAGRGDALRAVRERIQRKIRWTAAGPPVQDRVFLHAFYVALRARLEARLLLGKRKEDKHSR